MSWLMDFLTDTARQAAPGIHQAISDDQKKKRDLDAMRQTIPILVEQQKAMMPGELEKIRAAGDVSAARDATNREAAFKQAVKIQEMKNAAKQGSGPTDILGFLSSKVDVPTDPALQAAKPGVNYGAGEEAMSGVVPPTTQQPASNVLLNAIGLDPKQYTMIPHWSATGGVSMGPQQRPQEAKPPAPHYLTKQDGSTWVVDTPGAEPRQIQPATKTAQPWTSQMEALRAVQDPNNKFYKPEFAGWKPGQEPDPVHSNAAMQFARVQIPADRTGAQIDARAERAQKLGEIKLAEEMAKRDPRVIQRDLDKIERVQQITLKYAPQIEKARNLSRPMGEGAATQARLFENTLRSLNQMRSEFSDNDLMRYAGIWNRGENYIAQVAGVDKKFQRFLVLNEHLRSTAFQYGGKQLTPFEAAVVFGFTPHGREIFKEQYLEKMDLLEERTHFELSRVAELAKTPKGEYQPAVPQGTQQRLEGQQASPSGKHRLSGTKTNKPDGQYPLKDGTTITVKGGVVQ